MEFAIIPNVVEKIPVALANASARSGINLFVLGVLFKTCRPH